METSTSVSLTAVLALILLSACDDPSGPESPLEITTESLPATTAGEPYAAGLDASGGEGEYEWAVVSGSLPPGLVLTVEDLTGEEDALITGATDDVGSYTFTIQVRSIDDAQQDTREFTIDVNPQLILNATLPPGLLGAEYSVPLRATGGDEETYEWAVVAGELPPGLALEGTRIEGTPTATDTTSVTLRVTSGDAVARRTFRMRVVANRPDTYDITPIYVSDVPSEIQPHLDAAMDQWEEAIRGDLTPVALADLPSAGVCGALTLEASGTATDDIMILVNIDSIDGPGDVLGRAGPCLVRNSNNLPVLGILTLDSGDLLPLTGSETLTDLIAHEMGHVIGFGTLWNAFDLVQGAGTEETRYVGEHAVSEYHALGGSGDIPLEHEGGSGTVDSHWEESTFDAELMTGFIERVGQDNPLSRLSIASFMDLGYEVDLDAAEDFSLLTALHADGVTPRTRNLGHDIAIQGSIQVLDDRTRSPTFSPVP